MYSSSLSYGIRAGAAMAYSGIEMQLADTVRKSPDARRAMGGFSGVSNAYDDRREGQPLFGATYVKPVGEWNACEVRAQGTYVTAYINGVKVNEVDLATKNPYTGYDKHAHSGVRSLRGHFIWWVGNPKVPVQWRNLRVKELKPATAVNPTKRRFLYSDFKNRKIVYVDEANESATWEAALPEWSFDITRHGLNRLLVAQSQGWRLYDLGQLQFLKEFKDPEHLKNAVSVTRVADGRTFVLEERGLVHEYDAQDKWAFTYTFPACVRHGRTLRFTDRGTALIGIDDGVAEVELDRARTPEGRLVRRFTIPGSKSVYQGAYLPNGNLLVTGGYTPELVTFAPDGKILSRVKADQPEGLANFFYGGFGFRPNGNVLLANWTGHSDKDFKPGWKLIEFDASGKVVWTWNNPLAGTPCAVIPLD